MSHGRLFMSSYRLIFTTITTDYSYIRLNDKGHLTQLRRSATREDRWQVMCGVSWTRLSIVTFVVGRRLNVTASPLAVSGAMATTVLNPPRQLSSKLRYRTAISKYRIGPTERRRMTASRASRRHTRITRVTDV